jgi:hypothetical protein
MLAAILYGLYKRENDKHDIWEWKQLVSEADGKASQTKLMQLIGSITGTFIVIFQTLKDTLNGEIFIAYLAALGLSAGFSRWINKQENKCKDDYDVSEKDVEEFKDNNRHRH